MREVEVTPRVWERLQAVRRGAACTCCGHWAPGEQAALALYGPLARRDLGPVTIAQIGQSLDGRVATVAGDAQDVSGPDGLAHLHRLRALVDAVVIGVGTAVHDAPRLTVRLCAGDNPARVVIDPGGRLDNEARVLTAPDARRIVVQAVDRPRPAGVEVIRLAPRDGVLEPAEILGALRACGLSSLLIEGGGITIARFLEAGLLSRLQVSIAPLVIGGGPPGLSLASPPERLADALRPSARSFALGSDVVFDCALTDAAAAAEAPQHGPLPN